MYHIYLTPTDSLSSVLTETIFLVVSFEHFLPFIEKMEREKTIITKA